MPSDNSFESQDKLFNLSAIPKRTTNELAFRRIEQPIWTEDKASLIGHYLRYFVYITKHGVYIDGFAGPQNPSQPNSWSAKLVLENEPKWMRRFYLCDRDSSQIEALDKMYSTQPKVKNRTVDITRADFNIHIHSILSAGTIGEKTAAFCLIDQRTFECDWSTLQTIARHKSEMKIEIFYFVPTGWLARSISGLSCPDQRMLRWWGADDWSRLQNISGRDVAEAFRERFLNDLGYTYAYSWPIYEQRDSSRVMYFMIHATDHDEAPKLMLRAYNNATKRSGPVEQLRFGLD